MAPLYPAQPDRPDPSDIQGSAPKSFAGRATTGPSQRHQECMGQSRSAKTTTPATKAVGKRRYFAAAVGLSLLASASLFYWALWRAPEPTEVCANVRRLLRSSDEFEAACLRSSWPPPRGRVPCRRVQTGWWSGLSPPGLHRAMSRARRRPRDLARAPFRRRTPRGTGTPAAGL